MIHIGYLSTHWRTMARITFILTILVLLTACSDSPSEPARASAPLHPGSVTVHLNGTMATGYTVR